MPRDNRWSGALFWGGTALCAYAYFGYPLIVSLLARGKAKPRFAPPEAWPEITLLIAAYNEEAYIARKIENSLALDYPRERLQVLVVTDGSDDDTPLIARRYADQGVQVLHQPKRQGKMAAINRAMPFVRGDIVVFSDANNLYAPDALRFLIAPFTDRRVGAVSGAKTVLDEDDPLGASEGLYWKYESFIKEQENRLGTCTGVAGEILALRRSLFVPAPPGTINDDFYLMMQVLRQGYNVVYAPQARSMEHISASAQDEAERRARIVAGRYQAMAQAPHTMPWKRPLVAWQVISHKFTRPLVPFGMLAALAGSVGAVLRPPRKGGLWRLQPPWNIGSALLQGVFYLAALSGKYLQIPGKIGKALYLPVFLLDSNLAALTGLWRYLRGAQNAAWQRVRRRSI